MTNKDQVVVLLETLTSLVRTNFIGCDKNIKEISNSVNLLRERVVNVEKSIIGLEFKHNWKTAFWHMMANAIPVTIAMIVLWFTVFKGLK